MAAQEHNTTSPLVSVAEQLVNLGVRAFKHTMKDSGIIFQDMKWIIPAATIQLKEGRTFKSGSLVKRKDGSIGVQRNAINADDNVGSYSPLSAVRVVLSDDDRGLVMTVSFLDSNPVETVVVVIRDVLATNCDKGWLELFAPAARSKLGMAATTAFALVEIGIQQTRFNALGIEEAEKPFPAIVTISGTRILAYPSCDLLGERVISWVQAEGCLKIIVARDPAQYLLNIHTRYMLGERNFLEKFVGLLSGKKQIDGAIEKVLATTGVFATRVNGAVDSVKLRLELEASTVSAYWPGIPSPIIFMHYILIGSALLLISNKAETGLLATDPETAKIMTSALKPHDRLIPAAEKGSWCVLFESQTHKPVKATVTAAMVQVGPAVTIPVSDVTGVKVVRDQKNMCCIELQTASSAGAETTKWLAPEELAYSFWEEVDARRTAFAVAQAPLGELYRRYNEAKKHDFLVMLYRDILVLNRALESGVPLEELLERLSATPSEELAKHKDLFDQTVVKITLLTTRLPAIKQNIELLSAMYPYHWVKQEAEWMNTAFGAQLCGNALASERRRIVPLFRREIRACQANINRALSEIEAAVRPIQALLDKKEIENHWASQGRKFGPMVVQLALGATMLIVSHGTAWYLLASSIGVQGVSSFLGSVQQDREATVHFKRAATIVLPWWRVFMKTLMVSIFESSQFIADENTRAMLRDRQIVGGMPADTTKQSLAALSDALRQRILAETHRRFYEAVTGTRIRILDIVTDVESAASEQMSKAMNDFSEQIIFVGKGK